MVRGEIPRRAVTPHETAAQFNVRANPPGRSGRPEWGGTDWLIAQRRNGGAGRLARAAISDRTSPTRNNSYGETNLRPAQGPPEERFCRPVEARGRQRRLPHS